MYSRYEPEDLTGGWCCRGMIAFEDTESFNALDYAIDAFNTFNSLSPFLMANSEELENKLSYHQCNHESSGECTILGSI